MIEVDFESKTPIYLQIVESVMRQVKSGALAQGARLPTERELAASLDVARGTVKRAYKELADNNIIEIIQGSGSYVYSDLVAPDMERRRRAGEMMDSLYETLSSWGFSHEEISMLQRLSLAKKAPGEALVRIAVVDCNPESLALFKRQLNYIPGIVVSVFLVDSIIMDDDPAALLASFDLVLTTVTHYEQIAKSLGAAAEKLVAADVSPSRHTIVSICTLPRGATVGILCESNKFANLIAEQLGIFAQGLGTLPVCFTADMKAARRFIKRFSAVIAAPDIFLFDPLVGGGLMDEYVSSGGTLIPFDYVIDRGSLIHIEERVDAVLCNRAKKT